jgi:LmbE family N-acetylglucosaminyl deacetylase
VKRLIVAPHCDDEVLGCGGLLAKYPEQCEVLVLVKPTETRLREHKASRELLGYNTTHFLSLPDGNLQESMMDIVDRLDQVVRMTRPQEMYLPYPDLHQDHIATYEAGMRAARASMKKDHWYVPSVFVYDVAVYSFELRPTGLKFDTFEDISGNPVLAKGKAMDCYESETAPPPSPANGAALIKQAEALGATHHRFAVERYAAVRVLR